MEKAEGVTTPLSLKPGHNLPPSEAAGPDMRPWVTLRAMSSTLPRKHNPHYLSTTMLSTASSCYTISLLQLTTIMNVVSLISTLSLVLHMLHINLGTSLTGHNWRLQMSSEHIS